MAVAVVARLLWLHCGCLLVFLTVIALSLVRSHGGTLTRVAVTALAVFACGCTRTVALLLHLVTMVRNAYYCGCISRVTGVAANSVDRGLRW